MLNLNARKYVNFIYHKNFKDYEEKCHIELNIYENSQHFKNMAYYRIILAKNYLKMGYNIRFDEINDIIIYKKESKIYDDLKMFDLLLNMRLICTINGIIQCTYAFGCIK